MRHRRHLERRWQGSAWHLHALHLRCADPFSCTLSALPATCKYSHRRLTSLLLLLSAQWELQTRLVTALPFSSVSHTGANIEEATKRALAAGGIGVYTEERDTVYESVHCKTSDGGANIKKAWAGMEGGICVCHQVLLLQCRLLPLAECHLPAATDCY